MSAPLLSLRDISRQYVLGNTTVNALSGISFEVKRGEFVAIMGASGSGKSTLMSIIGCLDAPSSGQYLLNGCDVMRLADDQLATIRNKQLGFVFQSFFLLPKATAMDNVAQPLIYRGVSSKNRSQEALAALDLVGLYRRAHHKPTELSGGQRQRVAIARAIVGRPAVLLADEPTGNLDSETSQEIMKLLESLNAGGQTILLVTHDPTVAARTRRRIVLRDGEVLSDSSY